VVTELGAGKFGVVLKAQRSQGKMRAQGSQAEKRSPPCAVPGTKAATLGPLDPATLGPLDPWILGPLVAFVGKGRAYKSDQVCKKKGAANKWSPSSVAEACLYSVAQDSTRAKGTQLASICNPCHKSPDAEELETAVATQLLPDAEELG